jgi:hypothetical protein
MANGGAMPITLPKASKATHDDDQVNPLAPTWDKRAFRMLVVGQSGVGKSVMVGELVGKYLPWDTLTVVAKHLDGGSYDNLRERIEKHEDKIGRPVSVWVSSLEELPPMDSYSAENRNLVWFDDLMGCKPQELRPVVEMFTSGRHVGIAPIWTAQSYGRTPADIKRNASVVCIYKGFSANDIEQLWKDHGGLMSKDQFREYLTTATRDKHGFAVIDEQPLHERLKYRVGWDKVYLP